MRAFTSAKPVLISALSIEARCLYSCFCLFMLLGGGSSIWFYLDDHLGTTANDARRYYLGDEAVDVQRVIPADHAAEPSNGVLAQKPIADSQKETGGPELTLPGDGPEWVMPTGAQASPVADGESMRFKKPRRQIVETFHFHVFSVPVCLLIIAHIFMLCAIRRDVKIGMIVLAHVSTLVHLVAPPLIHQGTPGAAAMMFPSALVMLATWTAMTLWPLYDMWCRPQPMPPETPASPEENPAGEGEAMKEMIRERLRADAKKMRESPGST